MKTTMKTLFVSAIAIACAGGAYAQAGGAGGSGAGGSGGGTNSGAVGGPGYGASPGGSTLNQPNRKHMMRRRHSSGYGSPGTTGSASGRSTMQPGDNGTNSNTTGGYNSTTQRPDTGYQRHQ